jgi:hypothetical protein
LVFVKGNAKMQSCFAITPGGHLRVDDVLAIAPTLDESATASLQRAFGESSAAGLLLLAASEFDRFVDRFVAGEIRSRRHGTVVPLRWWVISPAQGNQDGVHLP